MIIELEILPDLKIMIDDTDKRIIKKYKWKLHSNGRTIFTNIKKHSYTIGRVIFSEYGHEFGKDELICYKDKNFLNNSKSNFVIRTLKENHQCRSPVKCRGGRGERDLPYGVYWCKIRGIYRAAIKVNKKYIWLGNHQDVEKANEAVSKKLNELGCRRKSE